MSVTIKRAGPSLLASSGTDLLTVPAGATDVLRGVSFANSHTVAVTVTAYILASAGTPANATKITTAVSIPPGDTVSVALWEIPMAATERLHLVPSVDAVVTATLIYSEETA